MHCSLRNRILIPLIAIQSVAVTVTALAMASLAARRGESQVVDRLNGVIDALGHTNFPHTASVLARMNGLSGAHFVAYDAQRRVLESSLPGLDVLPESLRSIPSAVRLDSLRGSPRVVLAGHSYIAVALQSSAIARGTSLLVLYPETSWRQAQWEAAVPPFLLGVGSLGAMAGVTSWIAHRVAERIRRVERQVALIAEGDFRELELGREQDEVRDLSRSINRMCVQLRELRGTVAKSERERLLAQLAAGLAHQLRNSLTGARMSIQLYARRHPAAGGDQSLEVALRQLAMTEEQVKGLLSLGRVERRPPEAFDLRQLLADVALLVGPSCRHAQVALCLDPAGPAVELVADPAGVRAAVLNLTLNAIEAAGPGGRVRLTALPADNEVTIEVSDTGPGPPAQLGDAVWEPFVTSKPEGVGLGLALARQVVGEHGGRFAQTRADGETRFALTLPLSRSQTHERGVE